MLKIVKNETFPLQKLDKRMMVVVVLWMRIFNHNFMKIPDTKQDRRRFIKEHLFQYQDKSFYCRALDCDVKVTDKSIEETAFQAAISKQATKLAIQLPQVIHNATILEIHLPPKAGRQTKRMKFIEIANLLANIPRVGMAKLTVGYIKNGECIEYAITEYTVIK